MKDLNKLHDDKLFDLLDGKLSSAETVKLKAQIESSAALKSRYEEAKLVHQMLASSLLREPSLNFTQAVMGKLNDSPAPVMPSFWKGLFLLTGMVITIAIAAMLASQGVFDAADTTVNLNTI